MVSRERARDRKAERTGEKGVAVAGDALREGGDVARGFAGGEGDGSVWKSEKSANRELTS